MDCFGTYFTHVQTCNVTRVQSATQWTASVHTLHMSKPVPVFKVLRNGLLRYILYTCPKSIVMNLTTCTHGAHKIHSGKTAKDLYLTTCTHGARKIHSCKNNGVHTAKPFRVYRRGPWPRVQTRPLPLRPWPEPSACTCDPGPEASACTCDPRKRVHSRPPDRHIYPL